MTECAIDGCKAVAAAQVLLWEQCPVSLCERHTRMHRDWTGDEPLPEVRCDLR